MRDIETLSVSISLALFWSWTDILNHGPRQIHYTQLYSSSQRRKSISLCVCLRVRERIWGHVIERKMERETHSCNVSVSSMCLHYSCCKHCHHTDACLCVCACTCVCAYCLAALTRQHLPKLLDNDHCFTFVFVVKP